MALKTKVTRASRGCQTRTSISMTPGHSSHSHFSAQVLPALPSLSASAQGLSSAHFALWWSLKNPYTPPTRFTCTQKFHPLGSSWEHAQLLPILGVYYLLFHWSSAALPRRLLWKKAKVPSMCGHFYRPPLAPLEKPPPALWRGLVCMSREVRGSCGHRLKRKNLKGVFLLALLVWKQRERGGRVFLILARISLAQPSWSTHACGSSSQMPCQALSQYKHQVCLQYMQGKKTEFQLTPD